MAILLCFKLLRMFLSDTSHSLLWIIVVIMTKVALEYSKSIDRRHQAYRIYGTIIRVVAYKAPSMKTASEVMLHGFLDITGYFSSATHNNIT